MLVLEGKVTINLLNARAQVRMTQEELAKAARLHFNVISRCERGGTINATSAWAILNALNVERAKQHLPPLEYEQMEWTVRGGTKKTGQ